MKAGDLVFPGLEIRDYYYFNSKFLRERNISSNVGVHLRLNTSKYNKSIDCGISLAASKLIAFSTKKALFLALGASINRQKILYAGTPVEICSSNELADCEALVQYRWARKKVRGFHSFGINCLVQSTYNQGFPTRKNNGYLVLVGKRVTTHWHLTGSHLYDWLCHWNLIYSITGRNTVSIYIQEDRDVNNAPDIQTGIVIGFPLKKNK